MIGIVIPAHNEADGIEATLNAAIVAGVHPGLQGEQVEVVLVLDSCTDATAKIASRYPVQVLSVNARNVGTARALGADFAESRGARWLAFTDADTLVASDWLVQQLALNADVVCGSIGVDDWTVHGHHAPFLAAHFARTYKDREGHRHIHGANLGVSTAAYRRAGGFEPLACAEDVCLVKALEQTGATVAWSAAPRVSTSARPSARARGGFGDTLLAVIAAGGNPLPVHMEQVARAFASPVDCNPDRHT